MWRTALLKVLADTPERLRLVHAERNRGATMQGPLSPALLRACWPLTRCGEAIQELAQQAGLVSSATRASPLPADFAQAPSTEQNRWLDWLGQQLNLEIDDTEITVSEFDDFLRRAGPAVLRFPTAGKDMVLLLLGARKDSLTLLAPDLSRRVVALDEVRDAILQHHTAPLQRDIAKLMHASHFGAAQSRDLSKSIAMERLAAKRIGDMWVLRSAQKAGGWKALISTRTIALCVAMMALFLLIYGLEIVGWGLLGSAVLNGRFDMGWLAGWMLAILSIIPLRLMAGMINANITVDVASALKHRLMSGSLLVDHLDMRKKGIGQLMARVMESQALEQAAIGGSLTAVVAVVETVVAGWVLHQGAGGTWHVLLLLVWLILIAVLGHRYFDALSNWTGERSDITHALLERMIGHRTVLAQDVRERRNTENDAMMRRYLTRAGKMDSAVFVFMAVLPGLWVLASLATLAPPFVAGSATPAQLAIGLGGMLFAGRALAGMTSGVAAAARGVVAWRGVASLLGSNTKKVVERPFVARRNRNEPASTTALISAAKVSFAYGQHLAPSIAAADFQIHQGERVLITGNSGGGKSTLASLITGLNQPQSGLLLLKGLDRHTLGDSWHHMATEAPQFHDNHIFNGSLAFNLLMGRQWPPSEADLEDARDICFDLGLGDVLDRMPAGINQFVGESGWQLSHGERSRVFLARALLQDADLTILDESFAALDPETLKRCLNCATDRARTLAVIAHP
jgi:ATP-binding cassette, subfamily B, bacterial